MKNTLISFILILFAINAFSQFVDDATPANAQPANSAVSGEWVLEFSDEFNGTEVNTTKWNIDNSTKSRASRPKIGISDWRWKPENVSVANGNLNLKVFKTGTNSMTNGSVNSYTKYHSQYGYYEARIKIGEADKGTHTAFWLQGPNMGNVDGTANDGAEIDIFESAWTGDYTKSVVHIDGYGASHQANTKQYNTPGIHSGFHTWGLHWTPYFMDIYYDGVFKVRYLDQKWVVHSPEFLWLSNGASFGVEGDQYFIDYPIGYLTETKIDYIRVWKSEGTTSEDDSILNQENWSLIYADSEDIYGSHLAIHAFDGNPYTFWHTEWKDNQPAHPHEIQIDLGDTAKIYGFSYLPRQDANTNGNISEYQFYAGNDSLNWGEPLKSETFSAGGSGETILFDDTISCKFIRLVALSEINGNVLTNIAEMNLIGYYMGEDSSIPTGITKLQNKSTVKIYPNPFSSTICLKFDHEEGISNYRIYSIDGRVLKEDFIPESNNFMKINTEDFNPGTFLFEVTGKMGREVKLLIKK